MWPINLYAQSMPSPDTNWLVAIPWWAWIGIIAIISSSLCSTVSSILQHRERMAMIRMGMHPDAKHDGVVKPVHPEGYDL